MVPNIKESHVFVSKHGKKTIKSADLTTLFYMVEMVGNYSKRKQGAILF
nr:MAG TPA: hypothetical protein [Caudoviricetes sp.]